jgi:nucleoid-associated protein YgaU
LFFSVYEEIVMKRILTLSLVLGLALILAGCQQWGKKNVQTTDENATALSDVKPETDNKAEAQQPGGEEPTTEATSATGGRTHVVQRGDTLFKLARQYYNGDASQWKRIWEANRAQIPNKDQLRVGQQLVIP